MLRWFARQGYLDKDDAKDMAQWRNGGFSVDVSVRIEADDRAGLERFLRYRALPPFAAARENRVRLEENRVRLELKENR